MKLTLKNFRCFPSLTLDLPDKGIVLLWGNSGVGKSSILKAIHFVLFGKELKVITLGEKKCSVSLTLEDPTYGQWEITRTKGPTHLRLTTLEGKFEDDVAQQMILSRFGDHFVLTNYIAQKSVNSFFGLSNTEKTAFLHHLTIQQFDIDSFKGKIKHKIKDRRTALTRLSSEVATYRVMFDEECKEGVLEEPFFPLKLVTADASTSIQERIQATLDEEEERRSKNELKLKKDIEREKTLQEEHTRYQQSRPLLLQLQESLARKQDELRLQRDSLPEEVDASECIQSKRSLETRLKQLKQIEEYLRTKQQYDTQRAYLIDSLEERMDTVQTEIESLSPVDPDRISVLQRLLSFRQQQTSYLKQLNKWVEENEEDFTPFQTIEGVKDYLNGLLSGYAEELEEFDTSEDYSTRNKMEVTELDLKQKIKDIETQLKGQRLCCPGCKLNVLVKQNALVPFDTVKLEKEKNDTNTLLKQQQKQISILSAAIQQKEENRSSVQTDIQSAKGLLGKYRDLEALHSSREDTRSEKEIQQEINDITSVTERRKNLEKDLHSLTLQLQRIDQHVSLTKFAVKPPIGIVINSLTIEQVQQETEEGWKELGTLQSKLSELEEIQQKREDILRQIKSIEKEISNAEQQQSVYEAYVSQEEQLQLIRKSITDREGKAEKFEKRLRSVEKYHLQKEKYDRQQRIKSQLEQSQQREKIAQRALAKAEELIECVQQAENITLENCLAQINAEVDDYMTRFFEDSDFQMSLFTYRESKDGDKKACIDIRIQREGEQYGIDSLSGGEFDRACLALFLAFNKVANREMIMLDECLSSLHSEAVEDIIEMIKEKFTDRLVLMTLHQANTGLFDRVIDVNGLRA